MGDYSVGRDEWKACPELSRRIGELVLAGGVV